MRIDLLPALSAEDGDLRAQLAALVNAAFAIGEAGMWRPGVLRVGPAEIGDLIAAGQLLALRTDGEVVGCVRVHELEEATWGVGMLAVDPSRQSAGGGGALLDAAERRARSFGAHSMQLELLVPVHGDQASKARLKAWYSSREYAHCGESALERDHPDLVPLLAVECTFEVWRKALPEAESSSTRGG